jgi:hypothetical protein
VCHGEGAPLQQQCRRIKFLPAASKMLVLADGSASGAALMTQTLLFRQRTFMEILQYTVMNSEAAPITVALLKLIHKRFNSWENCIEPEVYLKTQLVLRCKCYPSRFIKADFLMLLLLQPHIKH